MNDSVTSFHRSDHEHLLTPYFEAQVFVSLICVPFSVSPLVFLGFFVMVVHRQLRHLDGLYFSTLLFFNFFGFLFFISIVQFVLVLM